MEGGPDMYNVILNDNLINEVKEECTSLVRDLLKEDLVEVVLYGSCARGDYTEDSDIDIALLTKSDRLEVKKYENALATIATEIAMKHFAIVNFVCCNNYSFLLHFCGKGIFFFTPYWNVMWGNWQFDSWNIHI